MDDYMPDWKTDALYDTPRAKAMYIQGLAAARIVGALEVCLALDAVGGPEATLRRMRANVDLYNEAQRRAQADVNEYLDAYLEGAKS